MVCIALSVSVYVNICMDAFLFYFFFSWSEYLEGRSHSVWGKVQAGWLLRDGEPWAGINLLSPVC